ncbi:MULTISPECIES: hypothetical protein [unclassified Micromonospora]|uniref:hypothetical protein n=1 Tax=unclassified Micromonospora TaxID=2617518 RepID=UPI003A89689F
MKKILASAEAFGFGPASKLHAVSAELRRRGMQVHVVAAGASLAFAQSNADSFDAVIPVDEPEELAKVAPEDYDGALSVMDPYLVLWARVNGLPSVYVDSLYWFWQWHPDREGPLQHQASQLAATINVLDALRSLSLVPMHDSQYLAHHLSDASCVQDASKVGARAAALRGLGRVEVVNAVIDLTHRNPGPPRRWLATTSGLVNPLLPAESAVEWIRIVGRLLEEAADLAGLTDRITMAGHPDLLARAADVASARIELVPLSHREILEALNQAVACLTPPGLTTMLECAAYGVPFIMLPEQHYGHVSNFREVTACGSAGTFPHALIDPDGRGRAGDVLDQTLQVVDQLRRHFENRSEVWSRLVQDMADGMRKARDVREPLRAAQAAAVHEFVGGYTGARQVADVVASILGKGA